MICQRCGRCCVSSFVIIGVNTPEGPRLKGKPALVRCPNLSLDENGEASCSVHEEPWYRFTHCYAYGNPDVDIDYAMSPNRPCQIGVQTRQHKLNIFHDAVVVPLADHGLFSWNGYEIVPMEKMP